MPRENRLGIHVFEYRATIGDFPPRNGFQSFCFFNSGLAAMRLEVADDNIDSGGASSLRFLQHGVSLADTGGISEEYSQGAALRWAGLEERV